MSPFSSKIPKSLTPVGYRGPAHAEEPSFEKVPLGQVVHVDWPSLGLNVFLAQGAQGKVPPLSADEVPAGHSGAAEAVAVPEDERVAAVDLVAVADAVTDTFAEGVGMDEGEKGPPTAVRVTGDAAKYTLSPDCVTVRVHMPKPRKATLPVLKVPESCPAV